MYSDSEFRNNWLSGVQYNAFLSRKEQREIVSWLRDSSFKKYDLATMAEATLVLENYDPVLMTVSLNPSDWLLERSEMPPVGTNEDILFR